MNYVIWDTIDKTIDFAKWNMEVKDNYLNVLFKYEININNKWINWKSRTKCMMLMEKKGGRVERCLSWWDDTEIFVYIWKIL